MSLSVFIATRGRINNQLTMKSFKLQRVHEELKRVDVKFVVPRCEAKQFKKTHSWANVLIVPDYYKTGSICQHIAECEGSKYRVWIDDDFTLGRRRDAYSTSQAGSTVKNYDDVVSFFDRIMYWFKAGYAHGGISMRQANHYCKDKWFNENTRACGLVFFRTDVLEAENIEMNAVEEHQMYHAVLSLLELGYHNVVDYEFMFGHAGTNMEGGCSTYRSIAYIKDQNECLRALHPQSVRFFNRRVRNARARAIATEEGIPAVRIAWKKALGIRADERKAPKRLVKELVTCDG